MDNKHVDEDDMPLGELYKKHHPAPPPGPPPKRKAHKPKKSQPKRPPSKKQISKTRMAHNCMPHPKKPTVRGFKSAVTRYKKRLVSQYGEIAKKKKRPTGFAAFIQTLPKAQLLEFMDVRKTASGKTIRRLPSPGTTKHSAMMKAYGKPGFE